MAGTGERDDHRENENPIISKLNKNAERLSSQAFQLANIYFVFQGVIFSAISHASTLRCHHWWIPFSLSFMVSSLNGFAFLRTVLKYRKIMDKRDRHIIADEQERDRKRRIQERGSLPNHDQSTNPPPDLPPVEIMEDHHPPVEIMEDHHPPEEIMEDHHQKAIRIITLCMVTGGLVVVTIVLLIACRLILCGDKHLININGRNETCFSVCGNQNKCLNVCISGHK